MESKWHIGTGHENGMLSLSFSDTWNFDDRRSAGQFFFSSSCLDSGHLAIGWMESGDGEKKKNLECGDTERFHNYGDNN